MLMIYKKKIKGNFRPHFFIFVFAIHVFIFFNQVVQVSKSKRGGKGQGLQTAERDKVIILILLCRVLWRIKLYGLHSLRPEYPKYWFFNVFWIFMFSKNFVQQTLLSITKYPLELVFPNGRFCHSQYSGPAIRIFSRLSLDSHLIWSV